MRTNGRKFELYYGNGGHGGPYWSLFKATRAAARFLQCSHTEKRIVVRDRAKRIGESGHNVLTVEKTEAGIIFASGTRSVQVKARDLTAL